MKLAFFGSGQMGRAVAARAVDEGHEIGIVLTSRDAGRAPAEMAALLRGHGAAIDFSVASAVPAHVAACMEARVPLVEGTTGWQACEADARRLVEEAGGAMVHGENFSIGMNLFYRLVERAAELFGELPTYDAFIEEAHHAKKRDAPSGTALRLKAMLARHGRRDVPVASTRAGHIPGVHRLGFDSAADQVTLVHSARSREGFAAGALAAARWIGGRRGVHAFAEVLDDILASERRGRP